MTAAGLPSPLDRARAAGRSVREFPLFERLFGFSLAGGRRYVLLLALLTLLAGELGLLLWGGDVLGDWGLGLALAFVPVLAAAWAACRLCGVLDYSRWPRSEIARKLLAGILLIGLLLLSFAPGLALGLARHEPPFTAELAGTTMLVAGTLGAFPAAGPMWTSPLMDEWSQSLLIPFICAGWYVLAGLVLLLLDHLIRWRTARLRAHDTP